MSGGLGSQGGGLSDFQANACATLCMGSGRAWMAPGNCHHVWWRAVLRAAVLCLARGEGPSERALLKRNMP